MLKVRGMQADDEFGRFGEAATPWKRFPSTNVAE